MISYNTSYISNKTLERTSQPIRQIRWLIQTSQRNLYNDNLGKAPVSNFNSLVDAPKNL